ncbi:MAG: hypothetical protein KA198_08690, partial [Chitinophagaceae bacterium]|nr:hypothetical protein [Chitinophagaceae bacterium]
SLDKSGVDEIIFMPRIFSLDFLLNFCVMAKVEKHSGIFTDNHSFFYYSIALHNNTKNYKAHSITIILIH